MGEVSQESQNMGFLFLLVLLVFPRCGWFLPRGPPQRVVASLCCLLFFALYSSFLFALLRCLPFFAHCFALLIALLCSLLFFALCPSLLFFAALCPFLPFFACLCSSCSSLFFFALLCASLLFFALLCSLLWCARYSSLPRALLGLCCSKLRKTEV